MLKVALEVCEVRQLLQLWSGQVLTQLEEENIYHNNIYIYYKGMLSVHKI